MDYVFDQLSQSNILTSEELFNIKKSISKQYAHLPSKRQAAILAQVLHHVLEKSLVGVDADFWDEMKRNIFMSTLAVNRYDISKEDIFKEIVEIKSDLTGVQINAYRWLVQNEVSEVNLVDLQIYIKKTNKKLVSHAVQSVFGAQELPEPIPFPTREIVSAEPHLEGSMLTQSAMEEMEKNAAIQEEINFALPAFKPREHAMIMQRGRLEPIPVYQMEGNWPVRYRVTYLGWAMIVVITALGVEGIRVFVL